MISKNNAGTWTEDQNSVQVPAKDTSFPEEWKQEFEGLLYLGYLEKEVTHIPFHHFVVRTLTVNDKLEVSLLTKPFAETLGYGRAYKSAVVAAGLVSVDHQSLLPTLKTVNGVRQKYEYVVNNWYDAVVDVLFQAIDDLENQVVLVLEALNIIELPKAFSVFEKDNEETDNPKDTN